MKEGSVLHLHDHRFVHDISITLCLSNIQVFLSRLQEKMHGNTKGCKKLFKKPERCNPTEHSRSDRGFAPHFALTNMMELLLRNNCQAKVMPAVYLV